MASTPLAAAVLPRGHGALRAASSALSAPLAPNGGGWRQRALNLAVAWGVAMVAVTEGLSLLSALTRLWVTVFWLGMLVLTVAYALLVLSRARVQPSWIPCPSLGVLLLTGAVGTVAALIGLTAVVAPPNNFDAMTYHLSRVMQWQQQAAVSNYATHIVRQLYQPPGAEFAILQLQLLSGGDRFANLVQWASMVGTLVGVSVIARQLGADTWGQVFAAVVAITLPMGILEASSSQNDWVLAFWLVCFVALVLQPVTHESERRRWLTYAGMGGALGLAILTKGTAYVYAAPFVLWAAVSIVRAERARAWGPALCIASIVFVMNVGQYTRNFQVFGSPLGPGGEGGPEYTFTNGAYGPRLLLSNLVRNAALHLGTPDAEINAATGRAIVMVHEVMTVNPSDPRTTWGGLPFGVPGLSRHEDSAGNPLHLALILVSMALLAWRWRDDALRRPLVYALAVTTGFVLFCLLLRWQPWHSRLHLPLFVLWAPLIAAVLATTLPRALVRVVAVALLLSSLPWVLRNDTRPLVGTPNVFTVDRIDQYFTTAPHLREPYKAATRALATAGCSIVGVRGRGDDWEYPLWPLLQEHGAERVHVWDVEVGNNTRGLSAPPLEPCAIVDLRSSETGKVPVELLR